MNKWDLLIQEFMSRVEWLTKRIDEYEGCPSEVFNKDMYNHFNTRRRVYLEVIDRIKETEKL